MTASSAYAYVIVWATVCLIVVARLAWSQGIYALSRSEYWRFLFVPWKLTTFAMEAAGHVVASTFYCLSLRK